MTGKNAYFFIDRVRYTVLMQLFTSALQLLKIIIMSSDHRLVLLLNPYCI